MTQRRGFTLVEVLIALVIMGIVTGAIYRLLNTNQRLSLAQAEQVSLQSNVRTGSLIVPSELRELNTVLGSLERPGTTSPSPIPTASPIAPCGASASSARPPRRRHPAASRGLQLDGLRPRTPPGITSTSSSMATRRRGRRRLGASGHHRRGQLQRLALPAIGSPSPRAPAVRFRRCPSTRPSGSTRSCSSRSIRMPGASGGSWPNR